MICFGKKGKASKLAKKSKKRQAAENYNQKRTFTSQNPTSQPKKSKHSSNSHPTTSPFKQYDLRDFSPDPLTPRGEDDIDYNNYSLVKNWSVPIYLRSTPLNNPNFGIIIDDNQKENFKNLINTYHTDIDNVEKYSIHNTTDFNNLFRNNVTAQNQMHCVVCNHVMNSKNTSSPEEEGFSAEHIRVRNNLTVLDKYQANPLDSNILDRRSTFSEEHPVSEGTFIAKHKSDSMINYLLEGSKCNSSRGKKSFNYTIRQLNQKDDRDITRFDRYIKETVNAIKEYDVDIAIKRQLKQTFSNAQETEIDSFSFEPIKDGEKYYSFDDKQEKPVTETISNFLETIGEQNTIENQKKVQQIIKNADKEAFEFELYPVVVLKRLDHMDKIEEQKHSTDRLAPVNLSPWLEFMAEKQPAPQYVRDLTKPENIKTLKYNKPKKETQNKKDPDSNPPSSNNNHNFSHKDNFDPSNGTASASATANVDYSIPEKVENEHQKFKIPSISNKNKDLLFNKTFSLLKLIFSVFVLKPIIPQKSLNLRA